MAQQFTIATQAKTPDGAWETITDPVVVEADRMLPALELAYQGVDRPPAGRAWRVAAWTGGEASGPPDGYLECPYVAHETPGGWVTTISVMRGELRPGDEIVAHGVVHVVRDPIRWELTAPQHWVWTRRADAPELTAEQLAELSSDGTYDGTGYGFISRGPDHMYDRVVSVVETSNWWA